MKFLPWEHKQQQQQQQVAVAKDKTDTGLRGITAAAIKVLWMDDLHQYPSLDVPTPVVVFESESKERTVKDSLA